MSEDLDREWTLEQLIPAYFEAMQNEFATSFIGRVESYIASTQRADITPMVQRTIRRDDGTASLEPFPTLRSVPVVFPRWGSRFIHAPLSAGDFVLIVCCDRDPSRWLVTGELSPAPDGRLHHPAHAMAIGGVFPRTQPLVDTADDALVVGKDGGLTVRIYDNEIRIGGASATLGVARRTDPVRVTIPPGTFLVSATGGALNPDPVDVDGTIIAASSAVKST